MAKRKRTAARQKAITEYSKQRSRLARLEKSLISRGYIIKESFVPKKVKDISGLSTQRIKSLTKQAANINRNSVYLKVQSVDYKTGETISGFKARERERKTAARLGEVTKYRHKKERASVEQRKLIERAERQVREEHEAEDAEERQRFEDERRLQDIRDRQRLEQEKYYREMFNRGQIVKDTIEGMLDDSIKSGGGWGGRYLLSLLDKATPEQIQRMAKSADDALDIAAEMQTAYRPEHIYSLYTEFFGLITGSAPSAEESKFLTKLQEADSDFVDDPENWGNVGISPQDVFKKDKGWSDIED